MDYNWSHPQAIAMKLQTCMYILLGFMCNTKKDHINMIYYEIQISSSAIVGTNKYSSQ